ncbi:MAG TPA: response regulator transcription factor, partial [Candidatus Acidoferrum sp.]|nr:response regulator transcription factor [Candidatus Acidoferrum sp.]
ILVADDHEGTRGILKVLLQQHSGWEVCGEAATGEETLQKCIELKPDVIVKDWVMPGMDSIELTRQISKRSPDTAIVIFSFYDMPELIVAAKTAGVHRVATKNMSSLIAAIEDVLRSPSNRLIGPSESATQPSLDPPKENC